MNIRTKLFFINTLAVTILLGSLAYVMQQYSSNIIYEETEKNAYYSVSQLSQNIDYLLQSYEQIADFMYSNEEIQDRLSIKYPSFPTAYYMYADFIEPLSRSILGSKEILRLRLYTENKDVQFGIVRPIDKKVRQQPWYIGYKTHPKESRNWSFEAQKDTGVLRLSQRLNNLNANAELYMTLDVDNRLIYNFIAKENINQRFVVALSDGAVLMDGQGRNLRYGGHLQEESFYKAIKDQNAGSQMIEDKGKVYLLKFQTLESHKSVQGMKIISLIPVDGLLLKVNQLKRIAVYLFIIALLVSLVLMYMISTGLTKRLIRMANGMKRMNMERLQPLAGIRGDDEIGYLSRVFNDMILRLNRMIEEEYKSELKRKELQLKTKESQLYALQAQINPHYLFNTLNAIGGNLLNKGDQQNAEIIRLFAQSFRNLLKKRDQIVPISEELEMVNTYLRVQKIRFGERLIYELNVPWEFQQVLIPRLSLQTLVENVIIHVLEKKPGITVILIEAKYTDSGDCIISVEDNGSGITRDDCTFIKSKLQEQSDIEDEQRIGLRNIHQRLQLMFGDNYGLEIESEIGIGTKITMKLPRKEIE
ncbi:histidine kinase [Paenibacillus sp. LHD-38]|uniref:sensor histidine kinase n=1 Tax=Paenibacillus sp. LHD-38 TaxID=3072143 RepID=UPI00280F60C1|nr:histidine kinase [Paenibacillus sp. LHD-38]MDQ8737109.1 histidine kinase [Paenibacillus sp. LHD-38]